jgi:hypothetical protein
MFLAPVSLWRYSDAHGCTLTKPGDTRGSRELVAGSSQLVSQLLVQGHTLGDVLLEAVVVKVDVLHSRNSQGKKCK